MTRIDLDAGPSLAIVLAPERRLGDTVTLAIRAEDLLVAVEPVRGLSARNLLEAAVVAIQRTGPDVTLHCRLAGVGEGRVWFARVTPAAVEALTLSTGSRVWLAVKSHSVRLV